MPPSTFHVVSLGCPKNTVDAEVMLGHAHARGLRPVQAPEDADTIVINTCGFIESAKKESIDTIFSLARLKESGRCKRLIVTGCLVQRYAAELSEQIPEIDCFIGTGEVMQVADAMVGNAKRLQVGPAEGFLSSASTPRMLASNPASAYIKVAEGCNRKCAFCVIPSIKGPHRSRPTNDIVQEANWLADQGVVEVNLVSQDTLAYGRDRNSQDSLADLVRKVAEVDAIKWVRLLYLYPDELDDPLIELLAHHPNVVPYVDMPMQHASDSILKRMRRGHGEQRLRTMVEKLRTKVPDLAFRSAFIVGFPGETDADFNKLIDFIRWASFDHVGVFRYSDEETTSAFNIESKVTPRCSYNRFRRLMAEQRKISRARNRDRKGTRLQVLVEGSSEDHEWVLSGRHQGQAPEIDGQVFFTESDVRPGQLWEAEVTDAADYDLVVRVVGDQPIAQAHYRIALPVLR